MTKCKPFMTKNEMFLNDYLDIMKMYLRKIKTGGINHG